MSKLNNKTLSSGQVAKFCEVNLRTVNRWINRGFLKAFKLPGRGNYRVELKEFLQFLKLHQMPIPQEFATITSKRILIVDDDSDFTQIMTLICQQRGYETATAHDGFHAGILLGTFKPDILTLDLVMPDIDGFEVLHFIKQNPNLAPNYILVISNLAEEKLQETLALGADAYLQKPCTTQILSDTINALP